MRWIMILAALLLVGLPVGLGVYGCREDATSDAGPSSGRAHGEARVIDEPGFWYVARDDALRAAREQQSFGAVGYADGYVWAGGSTGVVHFDESRAQPGYNLYSSGHGSEAFLLAMDGTPLHRWAFDYDDLPGVPPMEHVTQLGWRRVRMLDDGSLLAIHGGLALLKLDSSSELQWVHAGGEHHDLEVAPDGRIVTLTRRPGELEGLLPGRRVVLEFLEILSEDGEQLQEISLFDAFRETPWMIELESALGGAHRDLSITMDGADARDVLHSNSVQVLDGAHEEMDPAFAEGNVLVCLRELNAFVVIDPRREKVVWFLQGSWLYPHDARLTEHGTLTLFDNAGHGGYSQVSEFDLSSGERLWSYGGDPPATFYSIFCGVAAKLPNGNVLATESCNGRALEVTPSGDVAWAFHSPHRAGPDGDLVAVLFEVERLPPPAVEGWLDSSE